MFKSKTEKIYKFVYENTSDYRALICYEKPGEFCHRHLVTEWFRNYGVECKEWEGEY